MTGRGFSRRGSLPTCPVSLPYRIAVTKELIVQTGTPGCGRTSSKSQRGTNIPPLSADLIPSGPHRKLYCRLDMPSGWRWSLNRLWFSVITGSTGTSWIICSRSTSLSGSRPSCWHPPGSEISHPAPAPR